MGTGLNSSDIASFARLGISVDLLEQAGIERVTDAEARSRFGINGSGDRAGIIFPYLNPETGRRLTARLRRDNPDVESGKLKNKYISPYGDRRHLFFPPGCQELLADRSVPLVFVEAEKSSLSLLAWSDRVGRRILPIGLGGCYGWRGRIGKTENAFGERVDEMGALPDLACASAGRLAYLLLDSNAATNPMVQQARLALSRILQKQGAQVQIANLPLISGVNGPDDLIAMQGDTAMAEVLDKPGSALQVFESVECFIRRFIVLSADQLMAVSLWLFHTYAMLAAHATPFLNVHSAEKQSGKSRLLEVLELLAANPWLTARVSQAVLVRKLDRDAPTLLLDEFDAAMGSGDEYAEALRGALNAAHHRGGRYSCCVGKNHEPKDFYLFCPIAFAGIGKHLPDTVRDRSIPIRLLRKKARDTVSRFRRRLVEHEARKLARQIGEWATAHLDELSHGVPDADLPAELSDRQQDGAEPLLAIADLIGCGSKARESLIHLFGGTDGRDQSNGATLLADVKIVFDQNDQDRLRTSDLIAGLICLETSPWAEWSRGKPITGVALARLLRPYDIAPKTIRVGEDTAKGYEKECFLDAWERYAPQTAHTPFSSEPTHSSQPNIDAAEPQVFDPSQSDSVTGPKKEESSMFVRVVTAVTGQPGEQGRQEGVSSGDLFPTLGASPGPRKKASVAL